MTECVICGETEKRLVRHHTDYEKDITVKLCQSCHIKLHKGSIKSNIPAPNRPFIVLKVTPSTLQKIKEKSDKMGGIGVSNVIRIAITQYLDEG